MKTVLLIAAREIRANLLKKASVISTVVVLVVMVGLGILGRFLLHQDNAQDSATHIGVSASMEAFAPSLVSASPTIGAQLATQDVAESDADQALADGEIDAYLSGTPDQPALLFDSLPDQTVIQAVTVAVQSYTLEQSITELGGDPAQVMAEAAGVTPTVSFVQEATQEAGGDQIWPAMISLVMLFMGIMMSGTLVSMGIVEEKTSRVVELLLATVKPLQLFAGKVFGNGVVGLAQVAIYGIGFALAAAISGIFDGAAISLGAQIGWVLLWFLIGFFCYVVLWAALASLVSRQEDIGSVTSPMMFLIFIPFYSGMYLPWYLPDGQITHILSMLPFFSPFMMPSRLAFTGVPGWEMAVALVANIAVAFLVMWIASRVYRNGVLHTGSRMKLRDALRAS